MSEVKTEFLFDMSVEIEEGQVIGSTPHGNRLIFYVKHGTFEGPKLKGKVLPGGGDWYLFRLDEVGELDVRVTLQTDDSHLIYISYRGIMHIQREVLNRIRQGEDVNPEEYYFRTAPFFETASEKYGWLNRIVSVGIGTYSPGRVSYSIYSIQ